MRMFTLVSLVAVGLGWALLVREPAYARTRMPTPTATPTVASTPTPTPWPTPTPTLPPERVAKFSGEVWLDAFGGYRKGGRVTAKIGDTVCGEEPPSCAAPPCILVPADPPPHTRDYHLDVVPAEAKPGCGYEGALVTFFVGGKQASQTAVWHAGTSQEVNLTTGPPFAFFRGELTFQSGIDESIGVSAPVGMYAFIGDNVCGGETRGVWKRFPYYVVVYSDEQQAGCGTEGARVTFKLRDRQGNIIAVAREKGVWHAWGDGNVGQELDLTMVPVGGITMGNVGTGGSRQNGTTLWAEMSLVLAAVGLGGFAAGAALRRRAM